MDSITIGKTVLGEGGFGKVILGTYVIDPDTGKKIDAAIKEIPASRMDLREFQLQARLSRTPKCNKHIACMYSMKYDSSTGNYYIAMEYIKGKDLFHYLLASGKQLTDAQIHKIFKDSLEGLDFIHKSGIAHGDIKLENLMFDTKTKTIKYIDFGFGCTKNTCGSSRVFHGTRYLNPPESTAKKTLKSVQVADIWALGSTFSEIITHERTMDLKLSGTTIKPTTDVIQVLKKHSPGHRSVFYEIIAGMMAYDPSKRWSIKKCLEMLSNFEK